jgi:phosphoglycolate phosphatase
MRLIIFDVDGTLIDTQRLIVAAMQGAFEAVGADAPTPGETLSIVGLSLPEAMHQLRPGLDAKTVGELVETYKTCFIKLRQETGGEAAMPLYPGIQSLLEALNAEPETLLGVATGKARRGLDHVYAAHDLGRYFVTSQTADFHPSKPHPAMIEAALSEAGVDASDAVMVGDTSFDMHMARSAGVRGIGVTWGYHPVARLREAGADMTVDTAAALGAVLSEGSGT